MSHSVTVTRTTTTSTTSAIILNTGYLKTWPGILKFFEVVLGIIIVGLIGYSYKASATFAPVIYFFLMSVTFLIGSFLLLLSCILSISTASIISKTMYELIYHGFAFLLYLAASLAVLIEVNANRRYFYYYDELLAASFLVVPSAAVCIIMIGSRGPTIITMNRNSNSNKGVNCCCCTCCTCLNWQFLKTQPGILKIFEAILGSFCQSLAINYGLGYAGIMGSSYHGFLTTASWCLMTTLILLFCYIFSEKSYSLIRQSLFETVFNAVACFSYLSTCSYLGFAVNSFLYPLYIITPFFQVYPAMTAAYVLGLVVGIIHGYDAYKSYQHCKGYR